MAQPPATVWGAAPTAEDWDAQRSLITQLYLDEDKPLKDVMALVNVNGFRATTKMFKTRITKWGIDRKNNKEHEARAILRQHARRAGKPTKMRLRGRTVDIGKVQSYFKRKRISLDDVLSSESAHDDPPSPATNMDLVCRTPSPVASANESRALVSNRFGFHEIPLEDNEAWRFQSLVPDTIPRRVELPEGLKIVESVFVDVGELCNVSMSVDGKLYLLSRRTNPGMRKFLKSFLNFLSSLPNKVPPDLNNFLGILDSWVWEHKEKQITGINIAYFGIMHMFNITSAIGMYEKLQAFYVLTKDADSRLVASVFGRIMLRLLRLIDISEPLDLIRLSLLRVAKDTTMLLLEREERVLNGLPKDYFARLSFLTRVEGFLSDSHWQINSHMRLVVQSLR